MSASAAPPSRHVSARGYPALIAALVVALLGVLVLGVMFGSAAVPIRTVGRVLAAHIGGDVATLDPIDNEIVWEIRVPRVLLAAVVGAALAVCGVALQALVRNPLADPFVLGATQGAALGAVVVIVAGGGLAHDLGVSGGAFIGAAASLLAVFALSRRDGTLQPTRLVLAGVALAYLVQAATSYIQLTLDSQALGAVLFWLLGSVASAEWSDLGLPTVVMVAATLLLMLRGRPLNALSLGDDAAAGLGVNVDRFRTELLVVTSLVVASVVAVAGGIGFVGLMTPHVSRFLVGPDHRRVLPVSILIGASFLVLVDLVARTIDRPNDLPLGIFTAAVGAPFLIWLLRRTRIAR